MVSLKSASQYLSLLALIAQPAMADDGVFSSVSSEYLDIYPTASLAQESLSVWATQNPSAAATFYSEYTSLVVGNPSYFASVFTYMANDLYNDAFPTSLVNLRSTNDAAYLSTFNSLFYQSAEPTWFANLPSNVKDFEYTYRPPSATPTSSVSSSPMPSSLFGSSSIPPGPSSMITSPPGQAAAPPPVTAVKTQFVTVGPHNGPNNNSPSSPQSTSSGLSTGAKAGIGVGVALGVLALIGFLVFFLLRRRRNKKNKATTERNMAQTPAHGSNYQSLHPSYQASQQQQGYYPPPQQGQYDPNYNPNYSAGYMQQPYTQTGSPPPAQYGYYDQKVENGRSPPMTNTDSSAFVSSQPTGTSAGRSSVPAATEPSELPGRTSAEDVRPELPAGDR